MKGWELNKQVATGAACTCCGVEVKNGVINVKNHDLFPLPRWVQDLYLCILYALPEPFLRHCIAVRSKPPKLCITGIIIIAGEVLCGARAAMEWPT